MLNYVVTILFYSQQLAASDTLDNYRRNILLFLLQVQDFTFLHVLQVHFSRSTFT